MLTGIDQKSVKRGGHALGIDLMLCQQVTNFVG